MKLERNEEHMHTGVDISAPNDKPARWWNKPVPDFLDFYLWIILFIAGAIVSFWKNGFP